MIRNSSAAAVSALVSRMGRTAAILRPMAMRLVAIVAVLAALTASVSCRRSEVFMHYDALSDEGWSNDTKVVCDVPPLTADGNYLLQLHLRATSSHPYPYKTIHVEVVQQWSDTTHVDTVECPISDIGDGSTGIAYRQHTYDVARHYHHCGDSARITLRHLMRRASLPGISDAGISLIHQ